MLVDLSMPSNMAAIISKRIVSNIRLNALIIFHYINDAFNNINYNNQTHYCVANILIFMTFEKRDSTLCDIVSVLHLGEKTTSIFKIFII